MKIEFEVKILDVNVEEVKERLQQTGAVKLAERSMRRFVYFNPDKDWLWLRLRDDGEKTTLTVKEHSHAGIDGTKELEVTVGDFEDARRLLEKIGFQPQAYQENKRVSYSLDGCGVEIDYWPRIPPYVEVEGPTAADVLRVVKLLGFTEADTTAIDVARVYARYNLDLHAFKELKFTSEKEGDR
ncbi:MAG: CYTH domain-containing protein [Candidatus Micrarchaeia archaeon]